MKGAKDIEITGITENSQEVSPGNLFIARKGEKFDGNAYISTAILAGASAILSDIYNPFLVGVTQLTTKDVLSCIAPLAKRFYKDPVGKLFLIGVTGTSGKTTITYLIKHLLEGIYPTGLMGTIETIIGERRIASELTTMSGLSSMKFLKEMVDVGITHAVMEVSSHALFQNRVESLSFDAAIFTNLTREHLDYHSTLQDYREAKGKLFTKLKKGGVSFINTDSEHAEFFLEKAKGEKVITYGIEQQADYRGVDLDLSSEGGKFTLEAKGEKIPFMTPLLGKFNVLNTLAAVALLHEKGVPFEVLQERLLSFPGVRGRLEVVKKGLPFHVFVDFAHKEDALANVLTALQGIKKGRLFTLFGCGGDRDREKRPRMATVAEKLSDYVIITSDNPRSEDPETILREIKGGFTEKRYVIIVDRREAIGHAIALLKEGDILLIAGKGHEKKQIVGGFSHPFDDVRIAEKYIEALQKNCVIR